MNTPPVTVEDPAVDKSRVTTTDPETVLFSWAGDSVVGKVRRVNEDSFGCRDGLFVVADGMGGHDAGDVASRVVVDQLVDALAKPPVAFDSLENTVVAVNTEVRDQASALGHAGMGATLVALVWVLHQGDPYLAVVNVGDSRCYVADAEGFRRVTHDHSLVQELVDSGEISQSEARTHPDRNVVTRAIGVDAEVVADYVLLPAVGQQRVLLCSDGVSAQLAETDVEHILADAGTPDQAVSELLASVMQGTAPDNATAVVVDVTWPVEAIDDASVAEITNPRGVITPVSVVPGLPAPTPAPASRPLITSVPLESNSAPESTEPETTADAEEPS